MGIKTLFYSIIILLSSILNAQISTENNIVGVNVNIQSKILNEEREIQVYLPENYTETDKRFPVLYILDGQRYFLHGVSLQKSFLEFKQSPEFIIVGISKLPSDRNRNYSVNAINFRSFIKNEVIEYIDTKYSTSKDRILFGWAYAGGFVLETMLHEPDLFNSFIAASPFPMIQNMNKVDSLIQNRRIINKLLFFTSGANEGSVKQGTFELNKHLTENAPESMNWTFEELHGEEHRSTSYSTLYRGLKKHFEYYPELQFNNLDEYNASGGLPHVYSYYQKRSHIYGFPNELSDWTMFSITRNAVRAENFELFEEIVNQFEPTGFIVRLSANRACLIAEFYLKNNEISKARKLLLEIADKNPNSERALKGIGDTYLAEKNERMANKYFKKAKELSKSN